MKCKIFTKKTTLFIISITLIASIFYFNYKKSSDYIYGVFIGATEENLSNIKNIEKYDTVVVDAANISSRQINKFHRNRQKVYSYINIGSIEDFRLYYPSFKNITLKKYKNWKGEYWIDVTRKEWKNYFLNNIAKSLFDKNIDGFFIDNADVFYHYQNEKVYSSLMDMLRELKNYNLPIIINGGDHFVKEAIRRKEHINIIDGINQETVFTSIDFQNNKFGFQKKETTDYLLEYLKLCSQNNIDIYILEYAKNTNVDQIKRYCKQNGYILYISNTIELDR